MGAFFTNVQLHTRHLQPEATLDRVVDALRDMTSAEGFVPAAEGEPADRTILVEDGPAWLSIYDESTEGQRQDDLDHLAARLSEHLATEALSILVHDSDVLELRLFRSGEQLDRFNSHPSYFGKVSAKKRKAMAGNAELWAPLLAPGANDKDLRSVWDREKLFAEETLAETSKLLGLDGGRTGIGFNYAEKSDPKYVKLAFRHAVRPVHETPAEAATTFEMGAYSPNIDLSVGFPFQTSCAVRNTGSASRGLSLILWGTALEQGLLSVDSVELVIGVPQRGSQRITAPLEDRKSADGKRLRMASFPELLIPAGPSGGIPALGATDPRKMIEVMLSSQIHANVYGKGLAKGEGKLHFGFVPTTNSAGQFAHTSEVKGHAASRRPLRAPEGVDAHLLRPLDGRGSLFALVSFDLDHSAAADVAAQLIERWGGLFANAGSMSLVIFPSEEGARPKTESAKAKGFFCGPRWSKLREELQSERLVCGSRAQKIANAHSWRGGDGFTFGETLYHQRLDEDPELPTLCLWLNVEEASEERIAEATKLANELMDEAMQSHRAVQALVGRWEWATSSSLDMTPYETACGMGGQCTLRNSWLTRFVRAVCVGTLWMGRSLSERMGDVAALRTAARVTALGDGLRVSIDDEGSLDGVEAALAAVLPTPDDWRRGVDRVYGRG